MRLQVLSLWARILRAVPNSRLVLKNKPFACDTARMHTLSLLAAEVRTQCVSSA
jgi:predicted O-linked N-acetylglucosamine transferase (SPINDLY family)